MTDDGTASRRDLRLLAELMAHPTNSRPFVLTYDNAKGEDLRNVAAAASNGGPYAVTVAPDVLAIGLDRPEDFGGLARLAEALDAEDWCSVLNRAGLTIGTCGLWSPILPPACASTPSEFNSGYLRSEWQCAHRAHLTGSGCRCACSMNPLPSLRTW